MPATSPFVSLTNIARMQALPRIILGPMLRRVEKTSISVFVACRESFSAKLVVAQAFDSNNQPLDIKVAANQLPPKLSGAPSAQSVGLGAHLHVALITLPLTAALGSNKIYQYSLQFVFGASTLWLDEADVLSAGSAGLASITYGNMRGPTFVLPGATPDKLRFAHASCRKPHGGKVDAMVALDDVLTADHANPVNRPQQLFLTGDQVYCDDVSQTLLYMLADASKALLDLSPAEDAPLIGPEYAPLVARDRRAPGNRQDTVFEAKLSSDAANSHLFYLGEFYAMYLFVWSPALWPEAAHYPSFEQAWPDHVGLMPIFVWDDGKRVDTGNLQPSESYRAYLADVAALKSFQANLTKIRRVLANVATYMIIDDHDVTDDWFLHREWCSQVLAAPLGRRIVQNAMAGIAVFQAWGNTPASFADVGTPPKGRVLLTRLSALASSGQPADWDAVGTALLPSIDSNGNLAAAPDAPDWFYTIDFGTYRLIALDTRTRRGFDGERTPPHLIAAADLAQQLPNLAVGNFALVLSATPIVGHKLAEDAFEIGNAIPKMLSDNITDLLALSLAIDVGLSSPTLSHRVISTYSTSKLLAFEEYVRTTLTAEFLDYEAWSFNRDSFENVLERLSQYSRVVILSGDVHYSFTNSVLYWNDRISSAKKQSVFAQLCSSAAKNTGTAGVALGAATTVMIRSAYDRTKYHIGPVSRIAGNAIQYTMLGVNHYSTNGRVHWQYLIESAVDLREQSGPQGRGFPLRAVISTIGKDEALEHLARALESNRLMVSGDNIGLVSFDWSASAAKVHHDIYWTAIAQNPQNTLPLAPHTQHVVPFDPPADADKRLYGI